MIQLTDAHENPELFYHHAKNYIKELKKIDKTVIWDNSKWEQALGQSKFIEQDGEVVGFVTSEVQDRQPFSQACFIQAFYVLPKLRKKHIGARAVAELLKEWKGDIYLYVLNKNMAAKSFWASIERDSGWYRKTRKDLQEESGYDLRVYVKKTV